MTRMATVARIITPTISHKKTSSMNKARHIHSKKRHPKLFLLVCLGFILYKIFRFEETVTVWFHDIPSETLEDPSIDSSSLIFQDLPHWVVQYVKWHQTVRMPDLITTLFAYILPKRKKLENVQYDNISMYSMCSATGLGHCCTVCKTRRPRKAFMRVLITSFN